MDANHPEVPDWYEYNEPNWNPLIAALSDHIRPDAEPGTLDAALGDWMWMGRIRRAGMAIEQYKHRDTRRYLNLDQDGLATRAWRVRTDVGTVGSGVVQGPPVISPVPLAGAIAEAKAGVR